MVGAWQAFARARAAERYTAREWNRRSIPVKRYRAHAHAEHNARAGSVGIHLILGELDLLATEVGKGNVGDAVISFRHDYFV